MKVKKLNSKAVIPTRNNPDDAGLDLCALEAVVIPPGEGRMIDTGIAVELPPNTVGMLADRSSKGKKGLKVCGGIIDVPYRGPLKVVLWNLSTVPAEIKEGEAVCQMLVIPILFPTCEEVTDLSETARGNKGFGSSGR